MTLNWGHKLILVFLIFGGMMSYMVYRCINTRYDLVSKEYYKDELSYQQVIEGTNRANRLSNKVTISQTENDVIIRLPNEMKGALVKGTAWFYYAPDAQRDRKIVLNTNADGEQSISRSAFIPGHYTVKISWESRGQQYYSEQSVLIQ